jgi:hypothetical protein
MRRLVVMAALLAATAQTASAQNVLLRIRPPSGQVTRYVVALETFMHGGPMAQVATDSTQPFMRMRGWVTTSVTAADGEEHTLNQVLDSAQVESPAMPQMTAMMGQMGTMMRGMTTITRMTSRGRVTALDMKLPPALEAAAAAAGAGPMGLSGGAGGLSSFVLLPERPVRVGSSWRDSMSVQLDSADAAGGMASFAATFTLTRLEGRVAVIGIDGTLSMPGGPTSAAVSLEQRGETTLDLDGGRVTAMILEMKGTAPSPMGGIPMRMTLTMTRQ